MGFFSVRTHVRQNCLSTLVKIVSIQKVVVDIFKSGIKMLIILKINLIMSICTNTIGLIPNIIRDDHNDARDDVSVGAARPKSVDHPVYVPPSKHGRLSDKRIQIAAVRYIESHCGIDPINFYTGSNRTCPLEPILEETEENSAKHRLDNSEGGSVSM